MGLWAILVGATPRIAAVAALPIAGSIAAKKAVGTVACMAGKASGAVVSAAERFRSRRAVLDSQAESVSPPAINTELVPDLK